MSPVSRLAVEREFFALARGVFLAKLIQLGGECTDLAGQHYDRCSWAIGEWDYGREMVLLVRGALASPGCAQKVAGS